MQDHPYPSGAGPCRYGGRAADQLRDVSIQRHFMEFAEGACLVCYGKTKVICTASIDDRVPPFLTGSGQGWITAEYAMLPKSSPTRVSRDKNRGGRAQEIQRLIGRSMRAVVNLNALGERTIYIDCDVLQADGGTRTAAITGAAVALHDALSFMAKHRLVSEWPMNAMAAAVSAGMVEGAALLDLDYSEDSNADADFNIVKTSDGRYLEVQGTAEHAPFDANQLQGILQLADSGIERLLAVQREALGLDS